MPTSRTRKEIMYPFTRSLIGPKLARMLIHVSVVVRTTIRRLRPSTPTLYWMPKLGIQSNASLYWNPAWPEANAASSSSDRTQTTRAVPRAARRTRSGRLDGMQATRTTPATGRNVIKPRIGRPNRLIVRSLPDDH
jgi:hypothetical protein